MVVAIVVPSLVVEVAGCCCGCSDSGAWFGC